MRLRHMQNSSSPYVRKYPEQWTGWEFMLPNAKVEIS